MEMPLFFSLVDADTGENLLKTADNAVNSNQENNSLVLELKNFYYGSRQVTILIC
jgi:hypothetical protein